MSNWYFTKKQVRILFLRVPIKMSVLNARCWFALLFFFAINAFCFGQGSNRYLDNKETQKKYLTSGQTDRWGFEGEKNEVLIISVETTEFDSVIGISAVIDGDEKDLFSVDDKGSGGQFKFRLPENGKYNIKVNSYKLSGGGNYTLTIRRYPASELIDGQPVKSIFNDKGFEAFYFTSNDAEHVFLDTNDDVVLLDVFDPKGIQLDQLFNQTFKIKPGAEYLAVLRGDQKGEFGVELKHAIYKNLELGTKDTIKTSARNLYVFKIKGLPRQFRRISITQNNLDTSELEFVHPVDRLGNEVMDVGKSEPITRLPCNKKGNITNNDVIFGREGQYEFRAVALDETEINVEMTDPTRDLQSGITQKESLKIGATHYFGFTAKPGDIVNAKLSSDNFDCKLVLYDANGNEVDSNDDMQQSTNSAVTSLINQQGDFRWALTSVGYGGGGDYAFAFAKLNAAPIKVGDEVGGEIKSGETAFWTIDAENGQPVFFNVKSSGSNPHFEIYETDGKKLALQRNWSIPNNLVIPVEFDSNGKYKISVSNNSKQAIDFKLRIIDANWDH